MECFETISTILVAVQNLSVREENISEFLYRFSTNSNA